MSIGIELEGTASARIAIVDYGVGNRRSVEKALAHAGVEAEVTADPDRIRAADGLLISGVGAFRTGAELLRASGLDRLVRERVAEGVPLLGICLGMQLLFEGSDERGGGEGLGLLPGRVRALRPAAGLKLPHIGWNLVDWAASPTPGTSSRCAPACPTRLPSTTCTPSSPSRRTPRTSSPGATTADGS